VRLRGLNGLELPLATAFAIFLHTLLRADPALPAWARPLASYGSRASFSLYAVHFPLLALTAGLVVDDQRLPPTPASIATVVAAVSVTAAFCWAFAWCTERRTGRLRNALLRMSWPTRARPTDG
jgi:peptidoglycan/LPS O-acetylase OafA/YrhL